MLSSVRNPSDEKSVFNRMISELLWQASRSEYPLKVLWDYRILQMLFPKETTAQFSLLSDIRQDCSLVEIHTLQGCPWISPRFKNSSSNAEMPSSKPWQPLLAHCQQTIYIWSSIWIIRQLTCCLTCRKISWLISQRKLQTLIWVGDKQQGKLQPCHTLPGEWTVTLLTWISNVLQECLNKYMLVM